jgi:hypothetical protein
MDRDSSNKKRKLLGSIPIYHKPYNEASFRALCGIRKLYDDGTDELYLLNNDLIQAWDKACADHD